MIDRSRASRSQAHTDSSRITPRQRALGAEWAHWTRGLESPLSSAACITGTGCWRWPVLDTEAVYCVCMRRLHWCVLCTGNPIQNTLQYGRQNTRRYRRARPRCPREGSLASPALDTEAVYCVCMRRLHWCVFCIGFPRVPRSRAPRRDCGLAARAARPARHPRRIKPKKQGQERQARRPRWPPGPRRGARPPYSGPGPCRSET
jgi:hypothetical protein